MSRMNGFNRLFRWPSPDIRRDVDDELQLHIEMKTRDLIDAGVDLGAGRDGGGHDEGPRHYGRYAAALGIQELRLAYEGEFAPVFHDCEVGAMPLWGLKIHPRPLIDQNQRVGQG
ncbi:MAG: hypothetical protein IIB90_14275 [Gemmatimonadetes bacterium]|nr:hypothetical protein [Gemmatimonadota bacterium]